MKETDRYRYAELDSQRLPAYKMPAGTPKFTVNSTVISDLDL
jgi:hypothetical protein